MGYANHWREITPKDTDLLKGIRQRLRSAALSALGCMASGDSKPFLRPLYCHYVFDDQLSKFDHLIGELCSIGKFIDTATLLRIHQGEVPLDQKYFHLSFDDGFRNNFTNAAPILLKHRVPATFFVSTKMISSSYAEASDFCIDVLNRSRPIEFLRIEELHQLINMGFEVGSHTHSHKRLSALQDALVLKDEIEGSKKRLEDILGVACQYIAWPYGAYQDISQKALGEIKRAGYDACFSAVRGSVIPNRSDLYQLPRHHFESNWPASHVRYFSLGGME